MSTFEKVFGLSMVVIVVFAAVVAIIIVSKLIVKRQMTGNNPLKKYHRNPKGSNLSRTQQRAINFGAILTEMNHEFCDSLQSVNHGVTKYLNQSLREWWGINSTDDAKETLERLKNKGHRQVFNVILTNAEETLSREPSFEDFLAAYKRAGLPIIDEEISNEYERESSLAEKHINILHAMRAGVSPEDADKGNYRALFEDDGTFGLCMKIYETVLNKYNAYVKYANNLRQTLDKLRSRKFAGDNKELSRINVGAWDMGRMVNVARWCYSCGYITENTAWEYIFFAEKECLHYTDWAAFGNAYVVGRALWGGDDESLDVTMSIVDGLLKDEESPWKPMALR